MCLVGSMAAMACLLFGRCACVDGFRAVVLREDWHKAYYRCADAWNKLGSLNKALAINERGRRMCSERADLDKQWKELQAATAKRSALMSALL